MKKILLGTALLCLTFGLTGCSFLNQTETSLPASSNPSSVSGSAAISMSVSAPEKPVSVKSQQTEASVTPSQPLPEPIQNSPAAIAAASAKLTPNPAKWNLHLVNLRHPLPDDYAPSLALIESSYCYSQEVDYYYDARAVDSLQQMLATAAADGVYIYVTSSYRSMSSQQYIYDREVQEYRNMGYSENEAIALGSSYVAYPGTSEHQLGLATDLVTSEHYWLDETFEDTEAFAWLSENAATFGFTLRYPKDKVEITGIAYEPWHYRYVGQEYATEMKQFDLCLEEYLEYLEAK